MEKELNIAEILKDKPKGLKLWSDTFGVVELICITESNFPINLRALNHCAVDLTKEGHYYNDVDDTLPCIVPSKSMRDWSKFAWKKGDVLTDNVSTICIFDSWANDDYTEFNAKYTLHLIASNNAESEVCKTNDFVPVVKDEDKQSYLATAETYFNVNLTKGSLWIEKPQFKDGDIVVTDYVEGVVFICICNKVEDNFMYCHARMNSHNKDLYLKKKKAFLKVNLVNRNPRPATDSEKQQLFAALEKEGKRWNSETKTLEDLPKKREFKVFQKVLVRDYDKDEWMPGFFFKKHRDGERYVLVCGEIYKQCIPYNDQTAHLLGTTDDWKGGEA